VVIGAFALATLQLATGSLDTAELTAWASQGSSQAMFVSLSAGIACGGLALWARRGWLWFLPAVPMVVGLLSVFWVALQPLPLLLGAVLGAMPLLLAGLLPRRSSDPTPVLLPFRPAPWARALVAVGVTATGALAMFAIAPLVPLIGRRRRPAAGPHLDMVLPITATIVLVALVAFGMSEAANPISVLTSLGFPVPLRGAVERIVGVGILAAAICMVAPWPLHRLGPGVALVPAATLMVYQVAGSAAPLGIGAWLPAAAMILVPSAILAAWRGYWANAVGSITLLMVPRPGWVGLGSLLVMIVSLVMISPGNPQHPDRISFPDGAREAALLSFALALGISAVLAHEVVLGSLLAAGVAMAAARPIRRLPLSQSAG
jgi:hypothetical protein